MAEVFVVGNGGREHEYVLSMAASDDVETVYGTNGNAGMLAFAKYVDLPFGAGDLEQVIAFENAKKPDLTIIGSENQIIPGTADRLVGPVLAPGEHLARFEGDKSIAIGKMDEFFIEHPVSVTVSNLEEGMAVIGNYPTEWVLKANGPASGKGVTVPDTPEEAEADLAGMLSGELFDGAGKDCVVIQERIYDENSDPTEGLKLDPELTAIIFIDGKNHTVMAFSQDHKRLEDDDKGPNTGGMGAYSPVPASIVSRKQNRLIYEAIDKSVEAVLSEGEYIGMLYVGFILASKYDGAPLVLEYNVRGGDPEIEVILPRLRRHGIDTYGLFQSTANGNIDPEIARACQNVGGATLTVCLAAEGYPKDPQKGAVVHGLDRDYGEDVIIHHAGTARNEQGQVVVSGGRVLYVTALGETIDVAADRAYAAIGEDRGGIHWPGAQWRTDIAHQARRQKAA